MLSDSMKALGVWALVVGLIVAISQMGGCSLDEMITVDVNKEVRDSTGAPPEVTLREARDLLEDYDAKHQIGRDRFVREINDGAFLEQLGISAVNQGIELSTPMIGNLPGGLILTSLLSGVGGFLMRRPSKKQLDAEYDAGREEALDTISRGGN